MHSMWPTGIMMKDRHKEEKGMDGDYKMRAKWSCAVDH